MCLNRQRRTLNLMCVLWQREGPKKDSQKSVSWVVAKNLQAPHFTSQRMSRRLWFDTDEAIFARKKVSVANKPSFLSALLSFSPFVFAKKNLQQQQRSHWHGKRSTKERIYVVGLTATIRHQCTFWVERKERERENVHNLRLWASTTDQLAAAAKSQTLRKKGCSKMCLFIQ